MVLGSPNTKRTGNGGGGGGVGLLRRLVTGVDDTVTPDEHKQRWSRTQPDKENDAFVVAPNEFTNESDSSMAAHGGRVANMVKEFEAVSVSNRTQPSASAVSYNQNQTPLVPTARTQNQQSSSSTTVPASLFQRQQQSTRSSTLPPPPKSPARANRFNPALPHNGRPTVAATTRSSPLSSPASPTSACSASSYMSTQAVQHGHSPSDASSSGSHVSSSVAPTMATRNSDSTHASSLLTNTTYIESTSENSDLESAVLGVADKVKVELEQTRVLTNTKPVNLSPSLQATPRIIETAPTPRKQPTSSDNDNKPSPHMYASNLSRSTPSPPLRPLTGSLFSEALPPSPPLQQVTTPSNMFQDETYSPLPLDTPPGAFSTTSSPMYSPDKMNGRRSRAMTVGSERRPQLSPLQQDQDQIETKVPVIRSESYQERTQRIEFEFAKLLDSMELPDKTVRDKMLQLALPIKQDMLRSAEKANATQLINNSRTATARSAPLLSTPFKPTHRRATRSVIVEPNMTPIQTLAIQIDEETGEVINPNTAMLQHDSSSRSPIKNHGLFVRKTKSTTSLRPASAVASLDQFVSQDSFDNVNQDQHNNNGGKVKSKSRTRPGHSRTRSGGSLFRTLNKLTHGQVLSSSSTQNDEQMTTTTTTTTIKGLGLQIQQESLEPVETVEWWSKRIQNLNCSNLKPKDIRKLRIRLRNEPPFWILKFLNLGGYKGLLMRFKELLKVEWREEQHDDQILFELLKCFKALTLTLHGRKALGSNSPSPFSSFAQLLFSDKRPGDLPCRQLLVELLTSLYDVLPLNAEPVARFCSSWNKAIIVVVDEKVLDDDDEKMSNRNNNLNHQSSDDDGKVEQVDGGIRRYTRKVKSIENGFEFHEQQEEEEQPDKIEMIQRRRMTHLLVHSLVQGPPNEKEESKLNFIKQAHKTRRFAIWVKEISDVVRDYFWIFCHSQNLFWSFDQINVDAVAGPKVPSGMTGGVEYEAMAYANCSSTEEAFQFHNDLFESGFERVLLTLRRASTTYYPALHLELSRYVYLARQVRFNLGPRVLSCLNFQVLRTEERMVVQLAQQRASQQQQQQHSSNGRGPPQL
ncbi:hypothetical protein OIO90_003323 [Microbotryomycetes sp. JL221]|nr:hypothetical protein OIO90_003323 [Microbotryomycetes sp. JL221]